MENNTWLIVIIVGVIAVIVGYLFGILDSRVTTALKEGREKEVVAEEPKPSPKLDEHEVLRVSIDQAIKWRLELDGVRIEPDGLNVEQRTRLVNVIVQIRPWIDGKTVASPAPAPVPAASPAPAPSVVSLLSDVSAPVIAKPATPNLVTSAMKLLDSEVKKIEPPKPPSIVAMIDEVLQKKLEDSPLAGRKIRLEEGSVGEVVVFVGLARYSGIDSVPDESIKAIIHDAVAEWDKKK